MSTTLRFVLSRVMKDFELGVASGRARRRAINFLAKEHDRRIVDRSPLRRRSNLPAPHGRILITRLYNRADCSAAGPGRSPAPGTVAHGTSLTGFLTQLPKAGRLGREPRSWDVSLAKRSPLAYG